MTVKAIRKRVPSEVLKRGYSDEEILHIYELGRLFLENGDLSRAEAIMHGLNEIAPDFGPAWLGMSYLRFHAKNFEQSVDCARRAFKLDPTFNEALLIMVVGLMTLGDYNTAGTYLGELGEKVETGVIEDPKVIRLYRAQLARYQSRQAQ